MNKLSLLFVYFLFGVTVSQDINEKVNKKEITNICDCNTKKSHIDLLIEDFSNQEWELDELICFDKILKIMNNVKNSTLWAIWIWDGMQSPLGQLYGSRYHLGNYDECLKAPWLKTHPEYKTQYCLADVNLSDKTKKSDYISVDPQGPTEMYINSISKHGTIFNLFTWGVCVPIECQPKSISKFVRTMIKSSHLGGSVSKLDISVDSCQAADVPVEYLTDLNIIIFLLIFIMLITILCTVLNNKKLKDSNTFGSHLIKAFCIKTNVAYLTQSSNDDIRVMHGIRSLTSGIVVALHVFFMIMLIGINNTLDFENNIDRFHLSALFHADVLVDTYLMMSGLLMIKSLMASGKVNPLLMILKRYIRFVLVMGLFLLLIIRMLIHNSDGPLWLRLSTKEVSACNKNWKTNLLMLGNYVDADNICYPSLWTIPCDFHLSAVTTIVFWIFQKNRRVGFCIFLVLGIAALAMPGLFTYQQGLEPVSAFEMASIPEYRKFLFKNPAYIWSHLRAGPYFVGIAAGYLLSVYRPVDYRKIIPKLWSAIGFIIAFSLAIAVMVKGSSFHDKTRPYSALDAALFASFNRSIWALAMAFIIIFCEYGTVPIVGLLLKMRFFIPLSKLSFGVYLVHAMVFFHIIASTRTPLQFHFFTVFINILGLIAICYIISLLLHIFFEAPIARIMNISTKMKTTKLKMKVTGSCNEYRNGGLSVEVREKKAA